MMTGDKLSSLSLINVYHNVDILDQIDHIIDIFANFKNRQLEFELYKLLFYFCYFIL
jgi:hypothetical protein